MLRPILIVFLLAIAFAVFLFGPLVSFGPNRPFSSFALRGVVSGLLVLCSALVAIDLFRRRRRSRTVSARAAYRATWRSVGFLSAPIAVLAGLSIWVIQSAYRDITDLTAEMHASLEDLKQMDQANAFSDIGRTTEVLDRVYAFTRRDDSGLNLPLLDPETDRAYLVDHYELMVSNHLRPHLLRRLEEQITSSLGKPDALYGALKVYLMLGQEAAMDEDYVLSWVEGDVSERFPGAYNQMLRENVILHTQTLLRSGRWNEYPIRSDLVTQARRQLLQVESSQLLYYRIMSDPVIDTLPDWRLAENGGPATARVFQRASGKPLDEGIPGIFTRSGFQTVFLPLASASSDLFQREAWVLGPFADPQSVRFDESVMTQRVLDIYYDEYISHWEVLLRDLSLVPTESLTHLLEVLIDLSGPLSPLRRILVAAAYETQLTEPIQSDVRDALVSLTESSAVSRVTRLGMLLKEQGGLESLAVEPGAPVEERFRWLHDFVDGSQPAMEDYILKVADIYRYVNEMSYSGSAAPEDAEAAIAPLRDRRSSLPPLVDGWTSQLLGNLEVQSGVSTRATLNAAWQSRVLPFCQEATRNRYPFDPASDADMSLGDFSRLFAPGGLIDTYFNEFLAAYVDRSGPEWGWRNDLGLSRSALSMFQRAAEIRNAYFPSGGGLEVQFQLSVSALDPGADYLRVEIGGKGFVHVHGRPAPPVPFVWPASASEASLTIGFGDELSSVSEDGPWALLRLFERFDMQRTRTPDVWRFAPNIEGKLAVIEVRFATATSPFNIDRLRDFSCPNGL